FISAIASFLGKFL
uniref:Ranatuerin-8 n=2 Tax=Aquarana catesbeiana TaxID=8400 RepID=TP8_AQUCT|nr:RecName: Full=Ranatuerin-8; AltName: Full=Temporin [Aquarana catesbeiana]